MNKKNKKEMSNVDELKNVNQTESEIEQAFVEDPLFIFIKKWQNVIFWCLLIIAGGYYGYQKYTEIRLNEQKEDADLFEEFRPIYANILTLKKDIKEKELEIEKASNANEKVDGKQKDLDNLKERLTKSLNEANSRIKPLVASKYYGSVTRIYSALLKKSQDDIKGFESELKLIGVDNYKNEKEDSNRFYKELASIVMAKAYLESNEKSQDAKNLLTNLAKDGKFFNVVAFKTLQTVTSGDEIAALNNLRDGIVSSFPEQADLLK